MHIYKTGDPCPCCGRQILITDADALYYFSCLAEILFPFADRRTTPADRPPSSYCDFIMKDAVESNEE